ncbi:hypothetical protein [Pseudoalteromonas rubra]|uniref:hypothetical protein n=1 Tax=Pseudoalteromonas rubra TaxID=43658 RepID=UPI002DBB9466|nr:hypothetical protein [Pseudoalteromonas rubra]MEC4089964.1 hypothetical protein [Pseudoalteromonas rubra]
MKMMHVLCLLLIAPIVGSANQNKSYSLNGGAVDYADVKVLLGVTMAHFFCGYIGRYSIEDVSYILTDEHMQAGKKGLDTLHSILPSIEDKFQLKTMERTIATSISKDLFQGEVFNEEAFLKSINTKMSISPKENLTSCTKLFPIHLRLIDLMGK